MSKLAKFTFSVMACLGMASAHSANLWTASIDSAGSKLSFGSIMTPAVSYGMTTNSNSVSVVRNLNPSPITGATSLGQYVPFKSLGGGAVLEIPSQANIPNRPGKVPFLLRQSLTKPTLAKALVKSIPIVGNAYMLTELLQEVGLIYQDSQWFVKESQSVPPDSPYSSCESAAEYPFPDWSQCNNLRSAGVNYWTRQNNSAYWPSGCNMVGSVGWLYPAYGLICAQQQSETLIPKSESDAISRVSNVDVGVLVDAANNVSGDDRVIDVLAREIASDSSSFSLGFPGGSNSLKLNPFVTSVNTVQTALGTQTSTAVSEITATTSGNTINYSATTTNTVTDETGNVLDTTVTTVNNTTAPNQPQQDIECGLPGTPACKIDETGTPQVDSSPNVDSVFDSVKTCLQTPSSCLPSFPNLSWSFSVPTACSPIPVSGFGAYLESIDICRFQSIFHDLMSMIWLAAGLFGASAMLFRDSQGA